jgi:hypothetical protein
MYDPNGLQVELTCRTDRFDSIMAAAGADASAMMSGWSERYRTLKEEKFGKEAIDRRARR